MATGTGLQFTAQVGALPADTFAVVSFELDEQLHLHPLDDAHQWAVPFMMGLNLASTQPDVDMGDVLDQPCELVVWFDGQVQRRISGVVCQFAQGDTGFRRTRYRVEVRPALWRLSLRRNSRIFQHKTPEHIITVLLQEMGIVDYAFALRHDHPTREYCVQYAESDFDFVTRLAAQEGMFVYHEYEEGSHRVVFADDAATLSDTPVILPYNLRPQTLSHGAAVQSFRYTGAVRSSSVTLKDYDFTRPHYGMLHQRIPSELHHQRETYEHFDYPGRYQEDTSGKAFTGFLLDGLRADAVTGNGQSNCAALAPGRRFTLQGHHSAPLNRDWQLVTVHHEGHQPQALEEEGGNEPTTYHNTFTVIDAELTWRNVPPPPPKMAGPQSARVVGPESEEIYCDEYGRIKVLFPWDRYGASDEHASCWLRVSQQWAGGQYGAMAIPRVGHEVLVSFLEGDPDRPIVTGTAYHAANRPPYPLPENKTRTVLRTQTHKGKGFNELRFEDKAGLEEIYIHGQKDLTVDILNDAKTHIKRDEYRDIDNQRTATIGASDHLTVEGEKRDHIKGDYSLTVETSLHQKLGHSLLAEAGQEIHLYAGDKLVVEAGSEITLKAGGSFVKLDPSGVTLVGPTIKLNSGGKPGIGTKSAPVLPELSKRAVEEAAAPALVGFEAVPALFDALPVRAEEEEEEEDTEEAEEKEPTPSVLRIGVFFDGTSNNTNNHLAGKEVIEAFLAQCDDPTEREKLRQQCASGSIPVSTNSEANDLTNIGKMHDLYLRNSRESLTVPVYISGIGTEDGEGDVKKGAGFDFMATSSLGKVELACKTRIVEEVKEQLKDILPTLGPIQKIEFDVFGFSRGASAARQFVNTIDQKNDHPLVVSMAKFAALTLKDGFDWASRDDVRIRFVGLLDTVVTSQATKRNVTLSPESADRVVHLIAKDEWRMNFASTRITDDVEGKRIAPNFTELVIPGAHSDVGGGYYSRWSLGSPSNAQPVLTENKVIRSFVGYELTNLLIEHTQTYRNAWAYATDRARQGWGEGVTVLSSPTSQPLLGQVNLRITEGEAASLGAGTLGINSLSRHVLVEVVLHRVVEGEYSRIPLHMMVEAARAEGVPFKSWVDDDPALRLTSTATPHPLMNLAKLDATWVDAGKQAGVSMDLTRQLPDKVYRQLRFEYLHCSADMGLVNYPRILGGDDVRRMKSNQEGGK